jgi:hypothetical protein
VARGECRFVCVEGACWGVRLISLSDFTVEGLADHQGVPFKSSLYACSLRAGTAGGFPADCVAFALGLRVSAADPIRMRLANMSSFRSPADLRVVD